MKSHTVGYGRINDGKDKAMIYLFLIILIVILLILTGSTISLCMFLKALHEEED
jgi:flagellar basal body-associated protein FliL